MRPACIGVVAPYDPDVLADRVPDRAVVAGVVARANAVLAATYREWRAHRTIRLGAAVAYYSLFAAVPVLVLVVIFAGIFVSRDEVQVYLADQISRIFGADGSEMAVALTSALDDLDSPTGLGLVGLGSLVLAATLVVVALQDAFSTIWELPVRSGIRVSIARRAFAFLVVLGFGATIVLSVALNAVTSLIEGMSPDVAILRSVSELVGFAGAWALGIGAVTLLFRYVTVVRVPWRAALVGGAVTALLIAAGTVLIGAYLRRYGASSVAGAAGAILLVLVWLYYESQILLAGAEFTRVLADPSLRARR